MQVFLGHLRRGLRKVCTMNERKGNGFSGSSDTMGRSLLWYSGLISSLGRIPRNLGIQGKKEDNASRPLILKDERGVSMIHYSEALLLCDYCMV